LPCLRIVLLAASLATQLALAQIPTFQGSFLTSGKAYSYTMVGQKPEGGGTTTIPTIILPISLRLHFQGHAVVFDATSRVVDIVRSPLFDPYEFSGGKTQFTDAMQRAQFHATAKPDWHTLLGRPQVVAPVQIDIPAANGYVLHSQKTGKSLAIVNLDFVKKHLPTVRGKLLLAISANVAYYVLGDATVCCTVGAHDSSVVIGSYFDTDVYPHFTDIQAMSQQLAEWFNDPAENRFPPWLEPPANITCGGHGESSSYLLEQPSDYLPNANSMAAGKYHLENVALLPWFQQRHGATYSFPDAHALREPAQPCSSVHHSPVTASPAPRSGASTRHALIGYFEGGGSIRNVSPQWDIIIATFAAPVKGSTSMLRFDAPASFQADLAYLKSKGKKVLISLGGGGEVVTLNTQQDTHNFVSSVTAIVEKYGFDGVDLDIETPSLMIDPGDTDFRHPKTPSIVNLIAAMHQLRSHFGPRFMVAEVPEAAQAQAGMQSYGGQFGSFLPVIYGTLDMLSFVDAQDYNTPPLEGLDGNYYFPGAADYHTALGEMMVHGFTVNGNMFPPVPPEKVAIGFPATPNSARNYTQIPAIEDALRYLIDGKAYANKGYELRQKPGYPAFLGAMFWAINEDRRNNYKMSNAIGPFLHHAE
jgi:chitinase